MSGQLLGPLWLVFGSIAVVTAFIGTRSWWLAGIGAVGVVVGLICLRLDWTRVPAIFPRSVAPAASVLLGFLGYVAPSHLTLVMVGVVVLAMWVGISLDLVDLVPTLLLGLGVLALPAWASGGAALALPDTVTVWPFAVAVGAGMYWLRNQLDAAMRNAAQAQIEVAEAALAAQIVAEANERDRAERTAAELEARTRVQHEVTRQATELSSAAEGVSQESAATANAVEEMSAAIAELARTASATDAISSNVAGMAHDASGLMTKLTVSSQGIMAAAAVIQSIASQTNLLALNATIESARAGEAGSGFAVVAQEVKELARQSGNNADTINHTLAEVNNDMKAAVDRVEEITASMTELQQQSTTLAAAIEEQSATIANISSSVNGTATQARRIADSVRGLEEISRS